MDSIPPSSDPDADAQPTAELDSGALDSPPIGRISPEPLALEEREVPVEFHGTGSEYFKIWIVNTALTILTLGIFSAWAKVRSRRYFYGNTRIEGSSFEYLARPRQILPGRIIAGIVLIAVAITSQFSLLANAFLFLVLFLVTPWILVKALRFNARYSAFRNVRFAFRGTTEDSYGIYFGLALLSMISLGIAVPYTERRARSWLFSSHRYGNQEFRDALTDGPVYAIYFKMAGLGLLVTVPAFIAIAMFFGATFRQTEGGEPPTTGVAVMLFAVYALALLAGLFLSAFQRANVTNLLFNGGQLGQLVGFRSTMRTGPYFGLLLGYLLLTLLTLGLAYPWMRVALARYRAETLVLRMRGTLDAVVDEAMGSGSAIADQLAEGLDIDIDLGI